MNFHKFYPITTITANIIIVKVVIIIIVLTVMIIVLTYHGRMTSIFAMTKQAGISDDKHLYQAKSTLV